MKIKSVFKKSFALILSLVMLVSVISVVLPVTASASRIERVEIKVGEKKALHASFGSDVIDPDSVYWSCNSSDVSIEESNFSYCYIKGLNVTGGMTAIVTCHYRVLIPYGTFTYYRSDACSFFVTVTSDKNYELEPIGNGFIVHWLVESDYSGGFEIEYSTSSSFTNSRKKTVERIRKTDVTITGLDANTKYYVRGRVYTLSSGNVKTMKGWMPTKTVVTRASSSSGSQSTVAKPPKTSISKIISREAGFSVSWKKQTKNTTGYQIQYATNSKFSGGKAKAVKGKTNTTVTGLTGGKRYYVRVRTYRTYSGKNYYSAWSAAKSFVTKKVAKPAATSISKFVSRAYGFSVSWAKRVKNLTGYQIQYATNSKFKNGKAKAVKGKTNTTITGLKGGQRYYVRVRTYRTYGGKNYFSAWSAAKSVVTKTSIKPKAPVITGFEKELYYADRLPAASIRIKKVNGCTGYQMQTSTFSNFKTDRNTRLYTCPSNKSYYSNNQWEWYLLSNEYEISTAAENNPLKCDTTYYFRFRTYKKVNGKIYYSNWSKVISGCWEKPSW